MPVRATALKTKWSMDYVQNLTLHVGWSVCIIKAWWMADVTLSQASSSFVQVLAPASLALCHCHTFLVSGLWAVFEYLVGYVDIVYSCGSLGAWGL